MSDIDASEDCCRRCHAGVTWLDGQVPDPEDRLCNACVWDELDERRADVESFDALLAVGARNAVLSLLDRLKVAEEERDHEATGHRLAVADMNLAKAERDAMREVVEAAKAIPVYQCTPAREQICNGCDRDVENGRHEENCLVDKFEAALTKLAAVTEGT